MATDILPIRMIGDAAAVTYATRSNHRFAGFLNLLFLILLLCNAAVLQAQTRRAGALKVRIPLTAGWQFREATRDQWYPAKVPGCVHTDLLSNHLIEDPFYRDNETKLQWIGKTDWEYQTSFKLTPASLAREHVELVFEGLDTYAKVFLNGTEILSADNMFRTWRVDCKTALKAGANTLLIRFRSPINEVLPRMAGQTYQLPSPNDQGEKTSPYTRKAPYQFGWDWGPRFVTSGIWKPVTLEAWNGARVESLQILSPEVSADTAKLQANVEVVSGAPVGATVIIDNLTTRTVAGRKQVQLVPGANHVSFDFSLAHPALWWPNGLGSHPLYSFRARVLINGALSDQAQVRTGVRSLQLRREADQWGKSFTFLINGVPVFAKGGNWIPADSFPARVSHDRYQHLMESVRDSNMNMLRVWGGGIYESNDFYDLCDEMGILVWQDFMFAGALYPGDEQFLDNVRHEAIDNVKRLRNHPSIAIWCGNNEIEAAWFHWGWKQNLPASLWDDYQKLFAKLLPEVCASYDPSRPYWPSSPSANFEEVTAPQTTGDDHYWAVWHGALPFSEYEKQYPRFMSEFGFQSFPQIETVNAYTTPTDHDIQSPVMLAHQRHPRGNQLIREYMLRDYPPPKDFDSFLYVSQVLQAEGIKIGAEHLRRIRARNMGSLYWQIDDCWPVASWSSIDYFGRWKALQFYARRFYNDLLISPHLEDAKLNFYVVSDRTRPVAGQIVVNLLNLQGQILSTRQTAVSIAPLSGEVYLSLPLDQLLAGHDPKDLILLCELLVDGRSVSSNEYFFKPFKDLSLSPAQIAFDVAPAGQGFKITLRSDRFAKAVYLSLPNTNGVFSDNYFDLWPSHNVEVEFRSGTPLTLSDIRAQLKVRSMSDAF